MLLTYSTPYTIYGKLFACHSIFYQYSPNALWAQDWIYEGLVSYGQDGIIEPALATNWDIESTETGQKATFKLREGVKFHDGEMWNCGAAVLNFNHVLSDTVKQRHQWFGAGQHLKSWTCNGDYELVLETSSPFYPLLQVRISNIIELN